MPVAKASVLEQSNAPLRLREFPLPSGLEPDAALARTEMAGICGTDVHLWKGQLPISLPIILGHETVGRIEKLGEELERDWTGQPLKIGDRVTWTSTTSCGECYYCKVKGQPTRCPQRRAYGIGYRCDQPPHFLGGYAEFHYLRPRTNLFKIPDHLPTEAVIGAGCALITAIHGIERICFESGVAQPSLPAGSGGIPAASAALRAGMPGEPAARDGRATREPETPNLYRMPVLPSLWRDYVVVQGAGPVGIAALAVSKSAGAGQVIVIGGPKHRLEMAERFGADHTIDIDEVRDAEARIDAVRRLTGGHGADAVLECVGFPGAVAEGMEMCRDGGKYLVLGHYCDAGTVAFNPHVITRKQLQVFGSWSSEPRHLKAALEFLRVTQTRFPFGSMVTDRFPLERAHEALMATANWQSAKSAIVP
ncbi:MAG: alcohol dehydrogenase [Verrucomicrobia bacterium]|nr:MAG: alcohol dehydrogenase [Verrucomicrobiota bacterium]